METKKPSIAISGATGLVGTNLRKFLLQQNISIITQARKKCKPFKLEKNLVFSDLDDIAPSALKNCTVLVHLIGAGAQTSDFDYDSVNVKQTEKIVNLCKKSHIKKIVYISGLGVNDSTTFGYFISKLKAEKLIVKSGLDYTILRASYIIGKNDPLEQNLRKQARSGVILIPGSGSYRLQPVSIDDVCKTISVCIANKKLSNKIIDLVGPTTISFEHFVRKFAKRKQVRIQKISLEKAYFEALNNPKKAVYGLDDLNIMIGDFTSDHKKLEQLCGFKLKTPVL